VPDHPDLPHLNAQGELHMVDVAAKPATHRRAVARGQLLTRPDVVELVRSGKAPKGDVMAVARVAGVIAAKRTSEWIPLAHPVPLSGVEIDIQMGVDRFQVTARCETVARTGVEMEALTAVSAALLTLYDMLKARDRAMTMSQIQLLQKSGGRSGDFQRQGEDHADRDIDQ
jgi:cyclic pyranopterin phosphate synthase